MADLDLDGRPDVAVLSDDAIQPFLNLPDGGWQALPELRLGAPGLFAGTLLVGDLDRDGRPDLVAVSSGGLLGVALGRPGGAFTGPTVTAIPPSAVSGALYDRDGDGRLDLVLSFQDYYFKNLGLLAGLPDGGFGPPAYLPVATPYAPGPVTTGDFTGDGVTDVMFTIDENNNGDTVVLWPGLVDGGFVTPGTAFTVGRTLASIASGDLDGDGRLDVVAGVIDAVSHLGGVVQQLVGDGKGGFAPPLPDTTDPDPRTLLIADVNGDGQPDLLTGNLGTSLTLHLTSGPGCPLLGETAPAGGCPAGMVWVPGSRNAAFGAAYAAENQPQDAGIRGFCLDAHEVTVADYAVCVAARICPDDSLGTLPNYGCNAGVAGLERHPENCVRATSAVTYCATRGGRLPTQWEWEYAARWGHGGDYPWGTGAPKGAVCYADAGTCPAGGSPGDVSALGLFDLAGNVRELTSDGVTMGSAYLVAQLELLRAPLRFTPIDAAGYHRDVGFRCAAGASAGGPLAARTGTPKGPLSCRAYQAANGGLLNSNAVCNGNTADGYYWKVGAKVKEYGSSGLGGCGIPRCDASAVGATGQTASWQLSAEWWDTADTYVAGGPGGACPATDGQLFPCAAAHCGAYLATCTAQVAP